MLSSTDRIVDLTEGVVFRMFFDTKQSIFATFLEYLFIYPQVAVGYLFFSSSTMAEISISIENKYVGGEHKVRALKKQFLGIILCVFMYLKWPWLLHLFV